MKKISQNSFVGAALLLGMILVVAAFLRVTDLSTIPPGLYHDEAVNGLDAWNILQRGRAPIFFEANGGREPLFIYLQTTFIFLFGPSAWALRIVSAIIGILTVAVFFQAARELKLPKMDANALALLASAGLAVSYWHLHWSRVGLRAILVPLLLCLTVYLFLLARRTQRARLFVCAGFVMGLSMYSYLAARLVPFLFLIFLAVDWRETRKTLRQNALMFVVASIVALPLAIYFLQNPASFFNRASDIAITASDEPFLPALAQNLARVVGMFFWQGDVEWRHGLALRPVLDPIAASLFALGFGIALVHWRAATARLAILWLAVMLAPTLFSQQAPDALRAIGAAPIVFWFIAIAWLALSARLMPRLGGTRAMWTLAGVVLILVGSGFFTVRDYFFDWANDRRAYRDFDGEFTEIAHWLNAQTQNVYVPSEIYSYPTVQFLTLARAGALDSVSEFEKNSLAPNGIALVHAADDSKSQYVLLHEDSAIPLNPTRLPELEITETLQGKFRALIGIAPVTDDAFNVLQPPNFTPLHAQFQSIALVGYALDAPMLTNQSHVGLTLFWKREGAAPREPKVFVELADWENNVIARVDKFPNDGISIARFPRAQIIPDRYWIPLPRELAPGRYALQMGLFDFVTGERWDVVTNGASNDLVELSVLKKSVDATPIPPQAMRANAQWANGIALEAYRVDTEFFRAGDTSEWTIYWRAKELRARDETIFVQVVNENGEIVAQADHDPLHGAYPTSLWTPNELIPDSFTLALPSDLAAGKYEMYVGWYERATNERVELKTPSSPNNAFLLQELVVRNE